MHHKNWARWGPILTAALVALVALVAFVVGIAPSEAQAVANAPNNQAAIMTTLPNWIFTGNYVVMTPAVNASPPPTANNQASVRVTYVSNATVAHNGAINAGVYDAILPTANGQNEITAIINITDTNITTNGNSTGTVLFNGQGGHDAILPNDIAG